jgi:hypothetical protein
VVSRYTDTWAAGGSITRDRVTALSMFGERYQVGDVIESAQRVAEALRRDSAPDDNG